MHVIYTSHLHVRRQLLVKAKGDVNASMYRDEIATCLEVATQVRARMQYYDCVCVYVCMYLRVYVRV